MSLIDLINFVILVYDVQTIRGINTFEPKTICEAYFYETEYQLRK